MYDSFVFRRLTEYEVFWFFCSVSFVYVFPLMHADYYFLDDVWRTLSGRAFWQSEGRVLIQWIYNLLGFAERIPNVYPLPLIFSIIMLSVALRKFVFWLYEQPCLANCLVVLPVLFNPLFLQNLSYQYDGAAMLLGLVLMVYAVMDYGRRPVSNLLVSAVLIACSLAIYQMTINFFAVLCCVFLVRQLDNDWPIKTVFLSLLVKVCSLVLGVLVYYVSAYQLISQERTATLEVSGRSVVLMISRMEQVAGELKNVLPHAMHWVVVGLLALSFIGYIWIGKKIVTQDEKWYWKVAMVLCYASIVPLAYFCIAGLALIFQEFNGAYRLLLGVSGLMLLVFYLSHKVVARLRGGGFVLVLPLIYCLSVSYAYGKVLKLQETFQNSVLTSMAYDIQHGELRSVERIYMIPEFSAGSLSSAEGLYRGMPILRKIFSLNFSILPEMLPVVGVNNVFFNKDKSVEMLISENVYTPILITPYYNFYKEGGVGYISMKKWAVPVGDEADICLKINVAACR